MGKKSGYSGPSATELANQKEAYRQQWDFEAKQKEMEELQDQKEEEQTEAKNEVRSRKGSRETFGNSRRGFTSKTKPNQDEIDFMTQGDL